MTSRLIDNTLYATGMKVTHTLVNVLLTLYSNLQHLSPNNVLYHTIRLVVFW